MFKSEIVFNNRETRMQYFYDKYKQILISSVLDVGADAQFLKPLITEAGSRYVGVGYGSDIDLKLNLEVTPYPFKDSEFHTVICLDVLEHLEGIHHVFDELCRISSKYLIVSLPNPWADFFTVLLRGDYSSSESIKFYGLPKDAPSDRHRWFFSKRDAIKFVSEKAMINNFSVIQVDSSGEENKLGGNGVLGFFARLVLRFIFRSDIDQLGLNHGTIWFVLEKK